MPVVLMRPDILDRLKETRGIKTDGAMADLGRVSLSTYYRYRNREESPSMAFLAQIGTALGLSLGELATIEKEQS